MIYLQHDLLSFCFSLHYVIWWIPEIEHMSKSFVNQLLDKLTVVHPVKIQVSVISPSVPIRIQMNSIHTPKLYLPKINCNIILPSAPRSSDWSLSFRHFNQWLVSASHIFMRTKYPAIPWIDHANNNVPTLTHHIIRTNLFVWHNTLK